jgi:glycosyltransferase involved in cell wall biosynthesis
VENINLVINFELKEKKGEIDKSNIVLFHVTTIPETLHFFIGQIKYMKDRGFKIHAVSSPGQALGEASLREDIPVHAIQMARRITPLADLLSLFKLYRTFKKAKPTIVHAHTPKGGLLGVLAARLARVPVVIYGMRGLPFVTQEGWRRKILILTETLACLAADRVITVSLATKARAVKEKFCSSEKIVVPGNGSSNGVDAVVRFNPEKLPVETRNDIRRRYQIPLEAIVLGFVGRLVKDKGIVELAEAWRYLRNQHPDLFLLLIGRIESQDPVPEDTLEMLKNDPRVEFTGPLEDIAPFYAAMDILVLPTYREGFPNTPLEAAAMELPVVITAVDGCVEAMEDGRTGLLVPPKNSMALREALQKLISNSGKRKEMGRAGRQRVLDKFRPEIIWQDLYRNYLELLGLKGVLPQL